jgi:nucleoside-diphosphate-sugar epimerase
MHCITARGRRAPAASGVIGRPLVAQLVAAGHTVVGMTRSDRGAQALRALGAEPVVADALDAAAVEHVVRGAGRGRGDARRPDAGSPGRVQRRGR